METFESFLRIAAYVGFLVIIPVIIIYFRVLNKIGTGFSVGVILTSFLVGILVAGSIREDSVNEFVRIINEGDEGRSKEALMRVVQLGADEFDRIDERLIENPELYEKLREKLLEEYYDIAQRYYFNNKGSFERSCDSIEELESRIGITRGLKHSLLMLSFIETLGGEKPAQTSEVESEIEHVKDELELLKQKCGVE